MSRSKPSGAGVGVGLELAVRDDIGSTAEHRPVARDPQQQAGEVLGRVQGSGAATLSTGVLNLTYVPAS